MQLESRTAGESRAPRPVLLAALAVLLVLFAYVPAVGGPFIWDDHQLLFASNRVSEIGSFKDYFGTAFWLREDVEPEGRNYYRPLVIASFAVDYALHGSNPGGFHVTNLLLHGLNTALLFALLGRLRVNPWTRFAGALLWGLFPRLTEAAAWISGRTDVLAGTFVLAALLAASSKLRGRHALAAACAFFGLLSKEVALAGLAAVAVMAWLDVPAGAARRARWLAIVPSAAAACAYAALRIWAVGTPLQTVRLSLSDRLLIPFEALGRYALMIVDAWHPNAQIGLFGRPVVPFAVLGAAVAIALPFLVFARRHALRTPLTLAAAITAAISLGLVLHVVPITVSVVSADRFLYIPVAALILLVAPALERLALVTRPKLVGAAVAALVLSFAYVTVERSEEWSDEISFWHSVFRDQHAYNSTASIELGNIFLRAGLHRHALALYLDAQRGSGDMNELMALNNVGYALLMLGQHRDAVHVLKQVVQKQPNIPKFHLTLGFARLASFDFQGAERAASAALDVYPGFQRARELRAAIAGLQKSMDKLQRPPQTDAERLEQARIFTDLDRGREALRLFAEVMGKPTLTPREANLIMLYALRFAEIDALRALAKGYAQYGRARAAEIVAALAEREQNVARLIAVWPSLGVRQVPIASEARARR